MEWFAYSIDMSPVYIEQSKEVELVFTWELAKRILSILYFEKFMCHGNLFEQVDTANALHSA